MGDDEDASGYSVRYLDGAKETSVWLNRPGRAFVTYPKGDTFEGDFNAARKKDGRFVFHSANISSILSTSLFLIRAVVRNYLKCIIRAVMLNM